jgi:hypothetical protein
MSMVFLVVKILISSIANVYILLFPRLNDKFNYLNGIIIIIINIIL